MSSVQAAIRALFFRFGVEVNYQHCDECGQRLSEWWKDVKPENKHGMGPATMKCICGAISDHENHPRRVKPWAEPVADFLSGDRREPTDE